MNKKQIALIVAGTLVAGTLIWMNSRTYAPQGAVPISPFNPDKYLGKWYEIARTDVRFEKDMIKTSAEYSMNADGSIKVINRGYHSIKKQWSRAEGKAKFRKSPDVAALKVSFFGPFYGGYNVVALDENYQYALIIGRSPEYLWILSRQTVIPEDIKETYLQKAASLGVDIDKLVWPQHSR
ncbi:MAG TPA: lipocalin [Porphyromonadaceae bacterium]|nr:lipocalin [Porphyromonadaceae bacterium]